MDGVQLSQGYRGTTKRSLLFNTRSPVHPGTHLVDLGRDLGANQGSLEWESSTLTTRPLFV